MSVQTCRGVPASVFVGMLAFGPFAASAQTISDGNSTFSLPAANTSGPAIRTGNGGGTGGTFIAGGDATDQLFQQWWWFRVAGGTREFGLSNRTGNNASGNTLRLDYSEPEGFRAVLTYVLSLELGGQCSWALRPARTRATILRRYSSGYADLDFGIADTSWC